MKDKVRKGWVVPFKCLGTVGRKLVRKAGELFVSYILENLVYLDLIKFSIGRFLENLPAIQITYTPVTDTPPYRT